MHAHMMYICATMFVLQHMFVCTSSLSIAEKIFVGNHLARHTVRQAKSCRENQVGHAMRLIQVHCTDEGPTRPKQL